MRCCFKIKSFFKLIFVLFIFYSSSLFITFLLRFQFDLTKLSLIKMLALLVPVFCDYTEKKSREKKPDGSYPKGTYSRQWCYVCGLI